MCVIHTNTVILYFTCNLIDLPGIVKSVEIKLIFDEGV